MEHDSPETKKEYTFDKEQSSLISVIIPLYNQQSFISECVESVLGQTYSNIEIIIIDDGSTDESGHICDEYCKKDRRVVVKHIPNGGVGNARNHGLEIMHGEWFCFVDADDWLDCHYLEVLFENAKQYDCRISACSHEKCYSRTSSEKISQNAQVRILESSSDCVHNFICNDDISLEGMVWNKLYSTELFGDIRFQTDLKMNEDCLYILEVMKRCARACLTTASLYFWYIHQNSASHAKPQKLDFSSADVYIYLYREIAPFKDIVAERELKYNYVRAVLRSLVFVKFDKKDEAVIEALERLEEWKNQIWDMLDYKERMEYILVKYAPWLLYMIRKIL